jgi:hypothetical protein
MQLRLCDGSPVSHTYPVPVGYSGVTVGTRSSMILVRTSAALVSRGTLRISASSVRRRGLHWRECPGPVIGCFAGRAAGGSHAQLIRCPRDDRDWTAGLVWRGGEGGGLDLAGRQVR